MLLQQFVVAHCYESDSYLSALVGNLRRKCLTVCPGAKEPKLGTHTTLLPPFRAHRDEMVHFAMGLRVAREICGGEKSSHGYAEIQEVDFFHNPGTDALIARLMLSQEYHTLVESCRKELPRFNEWVFPVLGDAYVPHICILEGAGLYETLTQNNLKLKNFFPIHRFRLPFPKIMVKVTEDDTTRWVEFNPST